MPNLFQKSLNWFAKTFSKDPSKMLILTGVAGWALSSLAQITAIVVNPKIKDEQKMFLIPQEFGDALVNIGSFFLITTLTKKCVKTAFTTGKFAPKKVRTFLNEHSNLYKDKVGTIDFNLDKVLKYENKALKDSYRKTKNYGTTIATVGAGIVASNIVTPILRNKMASNVQKSYFNEQQNKPKVNTVPAPNKISTLSGCNSMRI